MIPDYFSALTAYRAWDIEEGLLVGQAQPIQWPPYAPLGAACQISHIYIDDVEPNHVAPAPLCHCGIYAFKDKDKARERVQSWSDIGMGWSRGNNQPSVWGSVALWGRIIEHTKGYRAQYAYPIELWGFDAALNATLSERYGVPVHLDERMPEPESEWERFLAPKLSSLKAHAMVYGFWNSPIYPSFHRLGIVSSLDPATGVKDITPMIHIPPTPVAPPLIVGATEYVGEAIQTRGLARYPETDGLQECSKGVMRGQAYKHRRRMRLPQWKWHHIWLRYTRRFKL